MSMIKVLKLEYWEGSKFLIRQDMYDKDTCKKSLRVRMRNKFLSLSAMEQRRLSLEWRRTGGGMVKRAVVMMTEENYNKVKKLKE